MVKQFSLPRSQLSSRGSGFNVRVSLIVSWMKFILDLESSQNYPGSVTIILL